MYKQSLADKKESSQARSPYGSREYASGQPESTPFARSKGTANDKAYGYNIDPSYSRTQNPYDNPSYPSTGSSKTRSTEQGYPTDYRSKAQTSDPFSLPFGSYNKGKYGKESAADTSDYKAKSGPVRYEALQVNADAARSRRLGTEDSDDERKHKSHKSGGDGGSDDLDDDRIDSRKRMDRSYKEMMNTYAKQQLQASKQPKWSNPKTKGSKEPDDFTITHVNQTLALVRADGKRATNADVQSSAEWLEQHSVEKLQLALKHLVARGQVQRPKADRDTGKMQQHLQFDAADINEFEYKINMAIEHYTKRIKWLLQGSKRMFGLVRGSKIGILIDSSDANLGFGRQGTFSDSLVHLVDEQMGDRSSVYLAAFGSDVWPLWTTPMDVNCRTDAAYEDVFGLEPFRSRLDRHLEEAKEWASRIKPRGGCNLLKALKHVVGVRGLDHVLVILGSVPDQSTDVLCDYIDQLCVGRELTIDTVAYDCSNHHTNVSLRKLAEQSGGRYHCYSSALEEQIYTGSDISAVLTEIKSAQEVLNKISEMRQGLLGTALVSVMNEISDEVAKLPQARLLPRPPGHELPLNLEMPRFHASSSADWLAKHGLKAQNLDLYQVLAPNAYSYREEFVPVIRKTVQSQVHERAMAQFIWHDGSMKNIHVDMTQLFEYQKQLGAQVKLYEKRVDWLSSASRNIFGSVVENNVLVLLDMALPNAKYLVHVQHSMRLLLEQQLANKDYFNIVAFGSEVQKFRNTLVKPTPETLQAAWQWVLGLHCSGSRNLMGGLRMALENEEERQHRVEVEGVYLFTSGIPDQSQDVCSAFVEESCSGRNLQFHVVLFNVDDYDSNGAIASRYANITQTAECLRALAHCSGGRFHWFRETGIIESDDIAAISLEIEKALNFSNKASMLVESVKKKYGMDEKYSEFEREVYGERLDALEGAPPVKALPPPRHTQLSQTRMGIEPPATADQPVAKPAGWRPSSAHEGKPRPSSAKDPMRRVKGKRTQKAFFYTEQGDKRAPDYVGSVYDKYASKKSVRKGIKLTSIPDKEDQLTTKEWLRMYSLSKLKLDLTKLVSGPDCKHVSKPVKALHKRAEAKYCNVFPTINVGGTQKHLQLLPHELQQYEEQLTTVLKHYLQRLQWLLAGSRRVFGCVVEKKVCVLVDTSGSMDGSMDELKRQLASLVWDQLHNNCHMFNLIRFSRTCERWRESMEEPSEENCHDAVKWLSQAMANGNTCTLEALQMAFSEPELDAIYLLTDGKPDTSTSLVLREVAEMNIDRHVRVNTISFNCSDATANNFLKMLAAETSGRYHRYHGDFDAALFAHQLLSEGFHNPDHPQLPEFEGHDLQRLGQEITVARRFLHQAQSYRAMYDSLKTPNDQAHDCFPVGPGSRSTAATSSKPAMSSARPKSAK